jgi:hypothetical protein
MAARERARVCVQKEQEKLNSGHRARNSANPHRRQSNLNVSAMRTCTRANTSDSSVRLVHERQRFLLTFRCAVNCHAVCTVAANRFSGKHARCAYLLLLQLHIESDRIANLIAIERAVDFHRNAENRPVLRVSMSRVIAQSKMCVRTLCARADRVTSH